MRQGLPVSLFKMSWCFLGHAEVINKGVKGMLVTSLISFCLFSWAEFNGLCACLRSIQAEGLIITYLSKYTHTHLCTSYLCIFVRTFTDIVCSVAPNSNHLTPWPQPKPNSNISSHLINVLILPVGCIILCSIWMCRVQEHAHVQMIYHP